MVGTVSPYILVTLSTRLTHVTLECRQPWDLMHSLSVSGAGRDAEAVCRNAIEAICGALAASWRQGSRLAVDASFRTLADSASAGASVSAAEYQVPSTAFRGRWLGMRSWSGVAESARRGLAIPCSFLNPKRFLGLQGGA